MVCDKCHKDFNFWTEMVSISRQQTANFYNILLPLQAKKVDLCKACYYKRMEALYGTICKD